MAITTIPSSGTTYGTNLVLISTQTASGVSSIEFTTGIDTTYKEYKITGTTIHPATDTVDLQISFSTDGGTNFNVGLTGTAYKSYNDNVTQGLTVESASKTGGGATGMQVGSDFGNGNDECGEIEICLYDPSNTTFQKNFNSRCVFHHQADYTVYHISNAFIETTSAVNGVKLNFSSGNIDAGTFKLYGVR